MRINMSMVFTIQFLTSKKMFSTIINSLAVIGIEGFAIFNLYREIAEFGCRWLVIVFLLFMAVAGIVLAALTIKEKKDGTE